MRQGGSHFSGAEFTWYFLQDCGRYFNVTSVPVNLKDFVDAKVDGFDVTLARPFLLKPDAGFKWNIYSECVPSCICASQTCQEHCLLPPRASSLKEGLGLESSLSDSCTDALRSAGNLHWTLPDSYPDPFSERILFFASAVFCLIQVLLCFQLIAISRHDCCVSLQISHKLSDF